MKEAESHVKEGMCFEKSCSVPRHPPMAMCPAQNGPVPPLELSGKIIIRLSLIRDH